MTFRLGDELFAISVAQVREVLEISSITRVPSAPTYMRGVVNVRGKAVPVVDLRMRFGLAPAIETLHTRIVVMELLIDGQTTILGGIADSVHEVIELDPANINPPPSIAMRWRSEFIQGMGQRGDDFLIILDVDAVFASDELALVAQASEERGSQAALGSSMATTEPPRSALPAGSNDQPQPSLAVRP
jgi:purine-binding chemotaxis protein CheW